MRLILLLVAVSTLLTGCIEQSQPQPYSDPFQSPYQDQLYQPPAQPQPNCPDGSCPYNMPTYEDSESLGMEVSTHANTLVNTFAADERKGQCTDCQPQRPRIVRPVNPSVTPPKAQSWPQSWHTIPLAPGETLLWVGPPRSVPIISKPVMSMPKPNDTTRRSCPDGNCGSNAARQGAFVCVRCKRPTVGRQWHEVWADDDTALTCLCEKCWRELTPSSRTAYLRAYAEESIGSNLSPIVSDAIRESAKE